MPTVKEKNEPYVFSMPLKVRDYEVDSQGIVNNANYLHYLEHTRHEFCEANGVSFRQMQLEGIDTVVRRVVIDYLSSLRLGQTMESKLWLERKGARFVFHQDIFRTPDNAHIVSAQVTIVALENGRLSRGDRVAKEFAKFFEPS